MQRTAFLAFSTFSYVVFLATFLYLVAFVSGLGIVPRGVDTGTGEVGLAPAIGIDLGLVLIFAVQHSGMARPAFKRWWTRYVPAPIERSMYVLFASSALILIFWLWQPIAMPIWTLEGPAAWLMWALFALGWVIVLLSTFLISHFELFGLTQAWRHLTGRIETAPVFRTPLFYRLVRHPLYLGFFIAFWAAPSMTVGRLVFAAAMSAFMLTAIPMEEKDLVDVFGEDYRSYRRRTRMLLPRLGRRSAR